MSRNQVTGNSADFCSSSTKPLLFCARGPGPPSVSHGAPPPQRQLINIPKQNSLRPRGSHQGVGPASNLRSSYLDMHSGTARHKWSVAECCRGNHCRRRGHAGTNWQSGACQAHGRADLACNSAADAKSSLHEAHAGGTSTNYQWRPCSRSWEGSRCVCPVLRSRDLTGSCTWWAGMEFGGCSGMLWVFLRARGSASAMEPVSLVQVQLPGVFQDGIMRALHTGQYGV